jgi:hypothetical protein
VPYQAFISRDLSQISVEYLFVDAIFESLRRHGAKEALLVAWCIASDGANTCCTLAVGNKESQSCWTEFFRNMLHRGMRLPTTVASDGAPGLINALTTCFPASIRIRCWFHRLGNLRAKLPDEVAGEVMAQVYAVRDAPTLDVARVPQDQRVAQHAGLILVEREQAAAVDVRVELDLTVSLGHHQVGEAHRALAHQTRRVDSHPVAVVSRLRRWDVVLRCRARRRLPRICGTPPASK